MVPIWNWRFSWKCVILTSVSCTHTDEERTVAIQLEERYKGVRSPHKLKGGVSGCVRECAEAQGKDFGLIATDKGWNREYTNTCT